MDYALEELSESCYGDTRSARKIIEELTLKCNLSEDELRKFIREVARSCPIDVQKLQTEITKAGGVKEFAFQAIRRASLKGG